MLSCAFTFPLATTMRRQRRRGGQLLWLHKWSARAGDVYCAKKERLARRGGEGRAALGETLVDWLCDVRPARESSRPRGARAGGSHTECRESAATSLRHALMHARSLAAKSAS